MHALRLVTALALAASAQHSNPPTVSEGGILPFAPNGSAVHGKVRDHLAGWVSLTSFGAKCDGSSNDNTAMTNALAYIGSNKITLHIPGTCYVPGSFTIPTNVTLRYLGGGFAAGSNVVLAGGTPTSAMVMPHDVELHHLVRPVAPASQAPTQYPMGNDLELDVRGPADVWLKVQPLDFVATTSVTAGVNRVVTVGAGKVGAVPGEQVTVGDTSRLSPPSAFAVLLVDPYTANEEKILWSDWSVTSPTQLTITFAKAHTQPYIIRQEGSGVLEMRRLVIRPLHGATGEIKPMQLQDANLFDIMSIPSNLTTTYPDNAVVFNSYVTGNWRGLGDFRLKMPVGTGRFIFTNLANTVELLSFDQSDLGTFGATVQFEGWIQHWGTDFQLVTDKYVRMPKVHVDGSIRATFGGNNDLSGSLAIGAGGNATYTFTETYAGAPDCVCSDTSSTPTVCGANATTTVLTVYGTNGHAVHYVCVGKGN